MTWVDVHTFVRETRLGRDITRFWVSRDGIVMETILNIRDDLREQRSLRHMPTDGLQEYANQLVVAQWESLGITELMVPQYWWDHSDPQHFQEIWDDRNLYRRRSFGELKDEIREIEASLR